MANPTTPISSNPAASAPATAEDAADSAAVSDAPALLAQAVSQANGNDNSVGFVKGTIGDSVITRVDGSIVNAGPGTQIFRGDIVATREGASISVSFANDAEFFLGEKGRMLVESIAPARADQEPQSVYFVLHGQFGFSHRSSSFSGDPGAVVRTPVATLQVHNGRVAGRAAAEAVENVFTLLRNPDNSLGFTRVVTAGAAIVLQSELQTAQVVSLFREPVIVDRPDFADFVDIFGVAVSQWSEAPSFAPAAGSEGGEAPLRVLAMFRPMAAPAHATCRRMRVTARPLPRSPVSLTDLCRCRPRRKGMPGNPFGFSERINPTMNWRSGQEA